MRTIVNDSTLGIVDNDPLVASAIQSLLVETCAPIQILWTVTSAEQALEAMRTLHKGHKPCLPISQCLG